MELQGCSALITGASAGIGREMARQLAGRARALVLVARRGDRLEALAAELTASRPQLELHIHVADLTQPGAVAALCDSLDQNQREIDLLINNAGVGDHGPFVSIDEQRLEAIVQLNIAALTTLTRRLLPAMVARGRGAVLNVSSCAAFMPIPLMGVYAATKAYVSSFSEALHAEVRSAGVSVSALCPGPVHTEFNERALRPNQSGDLAPDFVYVAVEEVARLGLEGVAQNRPSVVPGAAMKIGMLLVRLTPMPLLRLALRFARSA